MIIISLGIDCDIALKMKERNLRNLSYPFDWLVTYCGVTDTIKTRFEEFLPEDGANLNSKYNIMFLHNTFPADRPKMIRRIGRFQDLLESSNDIVFIRKGHTIGHHGYGTNRVKNDLDDMIELDEYLRSNYPQTSYRIILTLHCGECFSSDQTYTCDSDRIVIYNWASMAPGADYPPVFDQVKRTFDQFDFSKPNIDPV